MSVKTIEIDKIKVLNNDALKIYLELLLEKKVLEKLNEGEITPTSYQEGLDKTKAKVLNQIKQLYNTITHKANFSFKVIDKSTKDVVVHDMVAKITTESPTSFQKDDGSGGKTPDVLKITKLTEFVTACFIDLPNTETTIVDLNNNALDKFLAENDVDKPHDLLDRIPIVADIKDTTTPSGSGSSSATTPATDPSELLLQLKNVGKPLIIQQAQPLLQSIKVLETDAKLAENGEKEKEEIDVIKNLISDTLKGVQASAVGTENADAIKTLEQEFKDAKDSLEKNIKLPAFSTSQTDLEEITKQKHKVKQLLEKYGELVAPKFYQLFNFFDLNMSKVDADTQSKYIERKKDALKIIYGTFKPLQLYSSDILKAIGMAGSDDAGSYGYDAQHVFENKNLLPALNLSADCLRVFINSLLTEITKLGFTQTQADANADYKKYMEKMASATSTSTSGSGVVSNPSAVMVTATAVVTGTDSAEPIIAVSEAQLKSLQFMYNGIVDIANKMDTTGVEQKFIGLTVQDAFQKKAKKDANNLLSVYEEVSSSLRVYVRINSGPGIISSYYDDLRITNAGKKLPVFTNKRSCQTIGECSIAPAVDDTGSAMVYRKRVDYEPVFYRQMSNQDKGEAGSLQFTECYPSIKVLQEMEIPCKVNGTQLTFEPENETKFDNLMAKYFGNKDEPQIKLVFSLKKGDKWVSFVLDNEADIQTFVTSKSFSKITGVDSKNTFRIGRWDNVDVTESTLDKIRDTYVGMDSDIYGKYHEVYETINRHLDKDYGYDPNREIYYGNCCYLTEFKNSTTFEPIEAIKRDGFWKQTEKATFLNRPTISQHSKLHEACRYKKVGDWEYGTIEGYIYETDKGEFYVGKHEYNINGANNDYVKCTNGLVYNQFSIKIENGNISVLTPKPEEIDSATAGVAMDGKIISKQFVIKSIETKKEDPYKLCDENSVKCMKYQPEINKMEIIVLAKATGTFTIFYVDALPKEARDKDPSNPIEDDTKTRLYFPVCIIDTTGKETEFLSDKTTVAGITITRAGEYAEKLCCDNSTPFHGAKHYGYKIVCDMSNLKGCKIVLQSVGYTFLQSEAQKDGGIVAGQLLIASNDTATLPTGYTSKIVDNKNKWFEFDALKTFDVIPSDWKQYAYLIDINDSEKKRNNYGFTDVNQGLNDLVQLLMENGSGFTIFGYGYSGTGKSYTLFGQENDNLFKRIQDIFKKYENAMTSWLGMDAPQNTTVKLAINQLKARLFSLDGVPYWIFPRDAVTGIFDLGSGKTLASSLQEIKALYNTYSDSDTKCVGQFNLQHILTATDRNEQNKFHTFTTSHVTIDGESSALNLEKPISSQDKDTKPLLVNKDGKYYAIPTDIHIIKHYFEGYEDAGKQIEDIPTDIKKIAMILNMVHCRLITDYYDTITKKGDKETALEKILLQGTETTYDDVKFRELSYLTPSEQAVQFTSGKTIYLDLYKEEVLKTKTFKILATAKTGASPNAVDTNAIQTNIKTTNDSKSDKIKNEMLLLIKKLEMNEQFTALPTYRLTIDGFYSYVLKKASEDSVKNTKYIDETKFKKLINYGWFKYLTQNGSLPLLPQAETKNAIYDSLNNVFNNITTTHPNLWINNAGEGFSTSLKHTILNTEKDDNNKYINISKVINNVITLLNNNYKKNPSIKIHTGTGSIIIKMNIGGQEQWKDSDFVDITNLADYVELPVYEDTTTVKSATLQIVEELLAKQALYTQSVTPFALVTINSTYTSIPNDLFYGGKIRPPVQTCSEYLKMASESEIFGHSLQLQSIAQQLTKYNFFQIGNNEADPVRGFTQLAINELLEKGFKVTLYKAFDLYGTRKVSKKVELYSLNAGEIIEYKFTTDSEVPDDRDIMTQLIQGKEKRIESIANELNENIQKTCKDGFSFKGETDKHKQKALINQVYDILEKLNKKRVEIGCVKPTPNNIASSRGHLFLVFKIEAEQAAKKQFDKWHDSTKDHVESSYMTIIDMAGIENPLEIAQKVNVFDSTTALDARKQNMFNWYTTTQSQTGQSQTGQSQTGQSQTGRTMLMKSLLDPPTSLSQPTTSTTLTAYASNIAKLNASRPKDPAETMFEQFKTQFKKELKNNMANYKNKIEICANYSNNTATNTTFNKQHSQYFLPAMYHILYYFIQYTIDDTLSKLLCEDTNIGSRSISNEVIAIVESDYPTKIEEFGNTDELDKTTLTQIWNNVILLANFVKPSMVTNLRNLSTTGKINIIDKSDLIWDYIVQIAEKNKPAIVNDLIELSTKNQINKNTSTDIWTQVIQFAETKFGDKSAIVNDLTDLSNLPSKNNINMATITEIYDKLTIDIIPTSRNMHNFNPPESAIPLVIPGNPTKFTQTDGTIRYFITKKYQSKINEYNSKLEAFLRATSSNKIAPLKDLNLSTMKNNQLAVSKHLTFGNFFERFPDDADFLSLVSTGYPLLTWLKQYHDKFISDEPADSKIMLKYNSKKEDVIYKSSLTQIGYGEAKNILAIMDKPLPKDLQEAYEQFYKVDDPRQFLKLQKVGGGWKVVEPALLPENPQQRLIAQYLYYYATISTVFTIQDDLMTYDVKKDIATKIAITNDGEELRKMVILMGNCLIAMIEQIINEGYYINETITHLVEFFRHNSQGLGPAAELKCNRNVLKDTITGSSVAENIQSATKLYFKDGSTQIKQDIVLSDIGAEYVPTPQKDYYSIIQNASTTRTAGNEYLNNKEETRLQAFEIPFVAEVLRLYSQYINTKQQSATIDSSLQAILEQIKKTIEGAEGAKIEEKQLSEFYNEELCPKCFLPLVLQFGTITINETEIATHSVDIILKFRSLTSYDECYNEYASRYAKQQIVVPKYTYNYWNNTSKGNCSNATQADQQQMCALTHQLKSTTNTVKMIPLLQYLNTLTGGKSKYVMMCLIRPEIKAQYCEGARKGMFFAEEVASSGVRAKPKASVSTSTAVNPMTEIVTQLNAKIDEASTGNEIQQLFAPIVASLPLKTFGGKFKTQKQRRHNKRHSSSTSTSTMKRRRY